MGESDVNDPLLNDETNKSEENTENEVEYSLPVEQNKSFNSESEMTSESDFVTETEIPVEKSCKHVDENTHGNYAETGNSKTESTEMKNGSKITVSAVEDLQIVTEVAIENDAETVQKSNKNKKKKRLNIFDSDSEAEAAVSETTETKNESSDDETLQENSRTQKRVIVFDSDSENEENVKNQVENVENNAENSFSNFDNRMQHKLKGLCDSDTASESEESANEEASSKKSVKPPLKSAKQKIKDSFKKTELTAKQAAKEKEEIRAESQRRTREAAVSLPYHRPKNRTITEFLKKRPCLATTIPHAAKVPASVAIKMSGQDLELMSKKLEERKKEVEEFYKSESDSDEDKENTLKEDDNEKNSNESIAQNCEIVSGNEGKMKMFVENEKEIDMSENAVNIINKSEIEKEKMETDDFPLEINQTKELQMNIDDSVCLETQTPQNSISESLTVEENKNESNKQSITEVNNSETIQQNNSESIKQNNVKIIDGDSENSNESNKENNHLIDENSESLLTENNEIGISNVDGVNEQQQQQRLNLLIEKYADKNETKSKSRLVLLQEKFAKIQPKLSGNPDDVIDLEDNVVRKNAVAHLMERFMKHVQPKNVAKTTEIQISVINASQGEIRKEILTVPHEDEETPAAMNEKPGAKLQKLREELQTKILQQRAEMWQKKQQQQQQQTNENEVASEEKDGFEDEILDNEDEEELTESEVEEEEEEEEQAMIAEEKCRKKSSFLDEEAEVSGEESDFDAYGEESDGNQEEIDEDQDEIDEKQEDEVDGFTKPRRRILNTFDEDSNSNDKNTEDTECLDRTVSWEDDGPPSHQKELIKTPARLQTQSKSQLGFVSPITNLTGLQGNSKFLLESPIETTKSQPNPEPSPFRDKKWQSQLQKKLFQENTQPSQNEPELTQQNVQVESISTQFEIDDENQPNTQELEEICSGNFTETSQNSVKNDEFKTQIEHKTQEIIIPEEKKTTKVDVEDEIFITQILNEDEMEKFKQKFASPAIKTNANHFSNDESEDEEEEEQIGRKVQKRKRLVFSDDESDGAVDDVEEDDEEIGLHDEDEDDDDDVTNDGARVVDYDSEENEIVEMEEAAPRLKVKDFVENEAELSESDWDSEDEDEKGLDRMEKEEGDEEKFDENELRKDLEKIHMRRVLDEDNREVKMLQELLLDDGELHGTGRQRQFRWKNIDDVPEEENRTNDDVDVYFDDDETEEEWRRKRHEREMFFKKEMEKSQRRLQTDDDNPLEGLTDSEILKLGQAALRKTQQNTPNEKTTTEKPIAKAEPFLAAFSSSRRGSFLTRDDSVLARIAEMTKVSAEVVVGGAKSTKNVVFHSVQSVTHEETTTFVQMGKKRKGMESTPRRLKKLRMQTSVVDS